MAVSVFKVFSSGEILSASDLNSSFSQVFDNGEDLGWPRTKLADMNGNEFVLDADADTSITADTDDQIDYRLGGTDVFRMKTVASAVNGIDLLASAAGNAVEAQAFGSDTDISLNLVPKGTGSLQSSGVILRIWRLVETLTTTSGSSVETTSITSTVTQIKVVFDGVSGTANGHDYAIELGSSTYSGSGADGGVIKMGSGSGDLTTWSSGQAIVTRNSQESGVLNGTCEIIQQDATTAWTLTSVTADKTFVYNAAGNITTSGVVDRLKISVLTSGNFDAGSIHIWEYS